MKSDKELRLLVCDPDPRDREMIEEFLRESPVDLIFTTPDTPFSSVLARHAPFNAAIIDLSNLNERSCDLIQSVKQVSPRAQIVFLSRLADESLWSEVLGHGAYDLLAKPPERKEFLRSVMGAIKDQNAA